MKKRVCPVCEREMKSAHYCSFCKSWVKEPYIREINYYLNESHPANESSCTYHNDPAPSGMPAMNQPKAHAARQARQPVSRDYPVTPQLPKKEARNGKGSLRWVIWLFIFIYIIFPMIGTLFNSLRYYLRFLF